MINANGDFNINYKLLNLNEMKEPKKKFQSHPKRQGKLHVYPLISDHSGTKVTSRRG